MFKRILLLLAVILPSLLTGAEKMVLVTGEWEPYTTEKSAEKGAFSEIVTAVFQEMKTDCEVKFYPWKRAEMMVDEGSAVAAFPYSVTDERKKTFLYSDPVMNSTSKFFYYKPSNKVKISDWKNYSDLKSYKIGGVLGYFYEKEFAAEGLNTEYVSSDELNIKKMQAGRVDIIPGEELVAKALIKKLFPTEQQNFLALNKPLLSSSLHLMYSKKGANSEQNIKSFNEALKRIKANGKYKTIMTKYGLSD